eukprot:313381_1
MHGIILCIDDYIYNKMVLNRELLQENNLNTNLYHIYRYNKIIVEVECFSIIMVLNMYITIIIVSIINWLFVTVRGMGSYIKDDGIECVYDLHLALKLCNKLIIEIKKFD